MRILGMMTGAILLVAPMLAGAAPSQPTPPVALFGISPAGLEILRAAGEDGEDRALTAMREIALEAKLKALEVDPIDSLALVKAVEAERVATRMLDERRSDKQFVALMKLTPADRKAYAKLEREMQAYKAKRAQTK